MTGFGGVAGDRDPKREESKYVDGCPTGSAPGEVPVRPVEQWPGESTPEEESVKEEPDKFTPEEKSIKEECGRSGREEE